MSDAPVLIRGGRLVDPSQRLDQTLDLLLQDGVVAKVDEKIAPPKGAEVVDAAGLVVAPGFVDLHVHLREPGFEYKETIASGTRRGGGGRLHDRLRDGEHRPGHRRRADGRLRRPTRAGDGRRPRLPDRRGLEGPQGGRAGRDRLDEGRGDRGALRRREARRRRGPHAPRARVRVDVRPPGRRPRGGPVPRARRRHERGVGLDAARPRGVAGRGGGHDGGAGRAARRPRGRAAPRRARLDAREPRRDPERAAEGSRASPAR